MDRYSVLKKLGEGSYGIVWKALDLETREEVAIKVLKNQSYTSWEDWAEWKALSNFDHPNIVRLNYAHSQNQCKYLVFEYMDSNLLRLIQRQPLSENTIRNLTFQLLQGLNYIHRKGYFHRDIKPENLLLQNDVLKIADFGMARRLNSKDELEKEVSTLWYTAPEVLLGAQTYDEAIDMWAVGVIMAELYNSTPLFCEANMMDQVLKIWELLGAPDDWPYGLQLAKKYGLFSSPFAKKKNLHWTLRQQIPRASNEAINLIQELLSWSPTKRLTASQALKHPFFQLQVRKEMHRCPVQRQPSFKHPNVQCKCKELFILFCASL